MVFAALGLALALGLAACGGADVVAEAPAADGDQGVLPREDAWLALVDELGLAPDEHKVQITGVREGDELALTITVPADAPGEYEFGDGLYGAQAYSYLDGGWSRLDTADIRTMIAALVEPGASVEVRLPVRAFEGGAPRVLVPVGGAAAWADIA
jgi:hypothetical protein